MPFLLISLIFHELQVVKTLEQGCRHGGFGGCAKFAMHRGVRGLRGQKEEEGGQKMTEL